MKYIAEYMREVLKVNPLGSVTFAPCTNGEECGNRLIIAGVDSGIEVWYIDYTTWLESKVDVNKFQIV